MPGQSKNLSVFVWPTSHIVTAFLSHYVAAYILSSKTWSPENDGVIDVFALYCTYDDIGIWVGRDNSGLGTLNILSETGFVYHMLIVGKQYIMIQFVAREAIGPLLPYFIKFDC